jgi:hypothetical protein
MSTVVRTSADGLPYLAPEIQLLYKSKAPRERDDVDFAGIYPLHTAAARGWLRDAIGLINPTHAWVVAIRSTEAAPATPTRAPS